MSAERPKLSEFSAYIQALVTPAVVPNHLSMLGELTKKTETRKRSSYKKAKLVMPGWKVTGAERSGPVEIYTARLTKLPTACPECGFKGPLHRHGKRVVTYLDVPVNLKPTRILGETQRYRCASCGVSFAMPAVGMCEDKRMTQRVIEYIESLALTEYTFSEISVYLGCNETTVRNIGTAYAERFLSRYTPVLPSTLGLATVVVDKSPRLLLVDVDHGLPVDVLPDTEPSTLKSWLGQFKDFSQLKAIYVSIGVGMSMKLVEQLPAGIPVIADRSELVNLANECLGELRLELRRNSTPQQKSSWLSSRTLYLSRLSKITKSQLKALGKCEPMQFAYHLRELVLRAHESGDITEMKMAYERLRADIPVVVQKYFKPLAELILEMEPLLLTTTPVEQVATPCRYVQELADIIIAQGRGYGVSGLRARLLSGNFLPSTIKAMASTS